MYLQQQGLLKEYYKTFRDTFNEDRTGMLQLMRVTGKSIETLDAELENYLKSFN
jgi:ribosomal protein S17E